MVFLYLLVVFLYLLLVFPYLLVVVFLTFSLHVPAKVVRFSLRFHYCFLPFLRLCVCLVGGGGGDGGGLNIYLSVFVVFLYLSVVFLR